MRKLATAAVSFSIAVFLSQYLLPSSCLVFGCAALAALSFTGLFFKGNTRLRIFLICLGLSFGLLWSFLYTAVFFKPAEILDGRAETVSAVVCDYPEVTDYGSKLLVNVKIGGAPDGKTLLYIYGGVPEVSPGNTIRFTAAFRKADTIYGEKTETFFSRGICLLGSVRGDVDIVNASAPFYLFPARIAHDLDQTIARIFPKSTAGLMQALILGDTAGVYEDTALSAALRTTGTSHIVSVSGMNIAFLMGFLGLFIRKKRVLTAVGIPVILLFMAVVGFMPPVVRAGVMQIFILSAPIFKRENDAPTSLSAALMLILLFNPNAAGSAGLQLSFAAILGIMLLTEKIFAAFDEPLRDKSIYKNLIIRKLMRFVIGSAATTFGALIFTVPLTALHFGTVSLITPLTNLCILWAVTLAFCGGIIAVIFGFIFAPVGSVLAFLTSLPANFVINTIDFFSHVPFSSVYTSNHAVVIWLVYVYLLILTVFKLRLKSRQLLYPVCLSAIALCFILLFTSIFSGSRQLSVTALDVGQGQSVVITSGKCTAVVDCGSSGGKAAGDIVTRYLQSSGRTTIDLLILTHYHADHANGVIELMERCQIKMIALPDPTDGDGTIPDEIRSLAAAKSIAVIDVTEDLLVSLDAAVMTLYAPIESESVAAGVNEQGLLVLCSQNGFDALITGDMGSDMEDRFIASSNLPDIELLVVGHHGSKKSTSDELLKAVRPEAAIISVGYNTYGHPSPETVKRLASDGIMVYRTDEDGNITINGW